MLTGIEAGFLLDRQWRAMRGEPDTTKKPTRAEVLCQGEAAGGWQLTSR